MNENEQQHAPTEQMPPTMPKEAAPEGTERSFGPIIGSIIVVAVIIVGGLYIWGSQLVEEARERDMSASEIRAEQDTTLEALRAQGTSNDPSAIEADLDSTPLDELDAGLDEAEAELR